MTWQAYLFLAVAVLAIALWQRAEAEGRHGRRWMLHALDRLRWEMAINRISRDFLTEIRDAMDQDRMSMRVRVLQEYRNWETRTNLVPEIETVDPSVQSTVTRLLLTLTAATSVVNEVKKGQLP